MMNFSKSTRHQIIAVTPPLDSASVIPQWMPMLHATSETTFRRHPNSISLRRHRVAYIRIHRPQYSTLTTITLNQLLGDILRLLKRSYQKAVRRLALSINIRTETLTNHQLILFMALVRLVAQYRKCMPSFLIGRIHLVCIFIPFDYFYM